MFILFRHIFRLNHATSHKLSIPSLHSPTGHFFCSFRVPAQCCVIFSYYASDDTQELVLQEDGITHDNVDDGVNENSLDEDLGEISNSCEVVPNDEVAVTYVSVRLSRYVCLRTMIVLLVALSSLTTGILVRYLL